MIKRLCHLCCGLRMSTQIPIAGRTEYYNDNRAESFRPIPLSGDRVGWLPMKEGGGAQFLLRPVRSGLRVKREGYRHTHRQNP